MVVFGLRLAMEAGVNLVWPRPRAQLLPLLLLLLAAIVLLQRSQANSSSAAFFAAGTAGKVALLSTLHKRLHSVDRSIGSAPACGPWLQIYISVISAHKPHKHSA